MAQSIVCCSVNFVLLKISDLDFSTKKDQDDVEHGQLSLEFFMQILWTLLPPEVERMIFHEIADQLTLENYCNSPPDARRIYKQKISSLCLASRACCQIFCPSVFRILNLKLARREVGVELWGLYSILNSSTSRWLTDHIQTIVCRSSALSDRILAALLGRLRGLNELC